MRRARVFATKTNMCPTDEDAYFGPPDLFTPLYDKAYISATFSWDIERARNLHRAWRKNAHEVEMGGPAFDDRGEAFIPGLFLKTGVVITSRGCPNNCPWCFVPKREGRIRELPIAEGNVIQDNNLLACSKYHIDKVFAMLKTQRRIDFSGGLESARVTDEIVEQLRGLSIHHIWLAYDHPNVLKPLKEATNKLKRYFRRDQIRCYVMIGYGDDTQDKAEGRLREAWEVGTLPFAMLYRDNQNKKSTKWRAFAREWMRPTIIKSKLKVA